MFLAAHVSKRPDVHRRIRSEATDPDPSAIFGEEQTVHDNEIGHGRSSRLERCSSGRVALMMGTPLKLAVSPRSTPDGLDAMFSLRLLGTPCITDPEEVLLSGPSVQHHRLALLALLALAPAPGMSRDKLMAYLWPESDSERARHLLKQAVYVLRGALGTRALATAVDEIRLNAAVVRVDVVEFDAALRRCRSRGNEQRMRRPSRRQRYGGP